ncbi:polysaccharide biosynthesis tyrosine autokinase [Larsenimonas suaedae]|uniref:Polysaccharide biosynthesis tyrosine autokinase n=1 Tax=Larsenimonas suaedae TaxID=1851019 RepID=A0ABU1GZG1_9GAMM|nr:polysaccharide biosynthesis tyrosine autokinase [Larsenimonas suaedae]MCM2971561.1 polysaccharide biosynthesis tyrosine autokinase [Larsenimonas suaedae]MDR5896817.1 polysaccharide biosynthesis tyrosine autokinase [Larsenimonas suaedae]
MASHEKLETAQENEDMDIGRILGLLYDRKWLIAGVTFIFAMIGVIYSFVATPIYQANSLIEIESRPNASNAAGEIGNIFGNTGPKSVAEMQILQSRKVLGNAANRVNLQTVVKPKKLPFIGDLILRKGVKRPGFASNWSYVFGGEGINVTRLVLPSRLIGYPLTVKVTGDQSYDVYAGGERVLSGLVGQLSQSSDGNVEVRVMNLDAPKGAEFIMYKRSDLSAIGSLKSRFSVEETGRSGTGILQLTLSGADALQIKDSLQAINEVYLEQNIRRQSAEAQNSIDFLKKQIPEVRENLSSAENKLNDYRVRQDSVDLTQETQSTLNQLVNVESQLNQLKFDEADLSQRFTKNHPQYQSLLEKKQQLNQEKENLQKRIDNLPETQQEILRLQRNVSVTQDIYVQLLNKLQELNIAKAGAVGNVRIIDDAVVRGPVSPRSTLVVLLFTFMGLILSVLYVFVRAALNKGIEDPDELEKTGLPVYATIPLAEKQQSLTRSIKKSKVGKSTSVDTDVLAFHDSTDMSVEAVRSLRTSLHFAMMEASNSILMITGASPSIGKSFLTSNLAAVCAEAGQKVLLIDADMRKGHVHNAFNAKSENGLSDILSGAKDPQTVVKSTKHENLSFISKGKTPPNPSELLANVRFSEFASWANKNFDLVIIDTPPVLAVTDAAVIGKHAGTTMMVVKYETNSIKEVKTSQRRLSHNGIEVKGCIFNAVEKNMRNQYSYYNYSYK